MKITATTHLNLQNLVSTVKVPKPVDLNLQAIQKINLPQTVSQPVIGKVINTLA